MPTLKEIGLYPQYIPSEEIIKQLAGKSEEKRKKITVDDYNRNYKEKFFEFRLQTRCIAALYERSFNAYKNNKCWKIVINCVLNVDREPNSVNGIYLVQVKFNIEDFFGLDDFEKKRKTLDIITKGVSQIVQKEGWDKTVFDDAHNKVLAENYENRWIWKKQKSNPGRQYIAKVLCEHGLYSCNISLIIEDKRGQVIKQEIVIREKPDEWAFSKYFGDLMWISNNEVRLISKKKDYEFKLNI